MQERTLCATGGVAADGPQGALLQPTRAGWGHAARGAYLRDNCRRQRGGTGVDSKRIEKIVAGWPGVTQDVKWGDDLVFSVASKMFVVSCFRGPQQGTFSFKVPDERFLEFTDRHGIVPAPYMARARWVMVLPDAKLAKGELESLLRQSYELVRAKLPKKTQRELDA